MQRAALLFPTEKQYHLQSGKTRIIRGMSVFHCHLLNHEDKGMMAKIPFQ
jgi:hypothetical protein